MYTGSEAACTHRHTLTLSYGPECNQIHCDINVK